MRDRLLVIALVSTGLSTGGDYARAQNASGDNRNLPNIVVTPTDTKPRTRAVRTTPRSQRAARPVATPQVAATPPAAPSPSPALYPTTPIPGTGIDADKVPAFVSTVSGRQIEETHSANITESLDKYVPSVGINEVNGNPFTPSLQFRGFVASPVSARRRGLRCTRTGYASTRRLATPSIGT